MESNRRNPATDAIAAHRPELYSELRKRNERRARVAVLLERRRREQAAREIDTRRLRKPRPRG